VDLISYFWNATQTMSRAIVSTLICTSLWMTFSVFGYSFDNCLNNLSLVLKHCKETNLILSWGKSHFMVQEGIVLGHTVSKRRTEVDQAKVELIEHCLLQ
jgi:hypothetical protein